MKKTTLLIAIILFCISCKEKTKEELAETNSMTEITTAEAQDEWITLFDGTSMEHWRGYLKEDMPAEWSIEDGAMADRTFEMLMGSDVPPRRKFIQTHARDVKNLDI